MITEKQIDAAALAFDEYFNSNPFDELTSGKKVARLLLEAALAITGKPQQAAAADDEVEQLIRQRDHREDIINQLCDAVLGPNRQEWSSAYHFEDAVREVQEQVQAHEKADVAPIPPQLDVRKILLKIEPGPDGSGVELYAKSVADVQKLLTHLSQRVESLEAGHTNGAQKAAQKGEKQGVQPEETAR